MVMKCILAVIEGCNIEFNEFLNPQELTNFKSFWKLFFLIQINYSLLHRGLLFYQVNVFQKKSVKLLFSFVLYFLLSSIEQFSQTLENRSIWFLFPPYDISSLVKLSQPFVRFECDIENRGFYPFCAFSRIGKSQRVERV